VGFILSCNIGSCIDIIRTSSFTAKPVASSKAIVFCPDGFVPLTLDFIASVLYSSPILTNSSPSLPSPKLAPIIWKSKSLPPLLLMVKEWLLWSPMRSVSTRESGVTLIIGELIAEPNKSTVPKESALQTKLLN